MGLRGRDQVIPVAAHPAAHRSRQPLQALELRPQAHHQFVASGIDQRGEGGDGGLAMPGLIGADHALRETRAGRQFCLGQPSSLPRSAEQGSSRDRLRIHTLGIADRRCSRAWRAAHTPVSGGAAPGPDSPLAATLQSEQDQNEWQIEWQTVLARA